MGSVCRFRCKSIDQAASVLYTYTGSPVPSRHLHGTKIMDYKKQAGAGDTVNGNKHGRFGVLWGDTVHSLAIGQCIVGTWNSVSLLPGINQLKEVTSEIGERD